MIRADIVSGIGQQSKLQYRNHIGSEKIISGTLVILFRGYAVTVSLLMCA